MGLEAPYPARKEKALGCALELGSYSLTLRGRPRHLLPEDWEREKEKAFALRGATSGS